MLQTAERVGLQVGDSITLAGESNLRNLPEVQILQKGGVIKKIEDGLATVEVVETITIHVSNLV